MQPATIENESQTQRMKRNGCKEIRSADDEPFEQPGASTLWMQANFILKWPDRIATSKRVRIELTTHVTLSFRSKKKLMKFIPFISFKISCSFSISKDRNSVQSNDVNSVNFSSLYT